VASHYAISIKQKLHVTLPVQYSAPKPYSGVGLGSGRDSNSDVVFQTKIVVGSATHSLGLQLSLSVDEKIVELEFPEEHIVSLCVVESVEAAEALVRKSLNLSDGTAPEESGGSGTSAGAERWFVLLQGTWAGCKLTDSPQQRFTAQHANSTIRGGKRTAKILSLADEQCLEPLKEVKGMNLVDCFGSGLFVVGPLLQRDMNNFQTAVENMGGLSERAWRKTPILSRVP
jgi:hypothetical protein